MDWLGLSFLALDLHSPSSLINSDERPRELLEESKKNSSCYHTKNCNDEKSLDIITLNEVSCHDRIDDCWLVIYDYVYDCTKFIKKHPGGQEVLTEYAGMDATLPFIGSGHTKLASKLLDKYLIGELPPNERLYRKPDGIKIVSLH